MPLIVAQKDRSAARTLQRRVEQGELRRVYAGIYTDDLVTPLEALCRREFYTLCALLASGAVISHRSGLESGPTKDGTVFLSGPYRRDIKLPGMHLRIAQGAGPQQNDIRIPTFHGDAYRSSQARALLENLTSSRGPLEERRTLGPTGVEHWLDRFISHNTHDAVNQLRDSARELAEPLSLQAEFKRLDHTIGALLGTRTHRLSAPPAIARAAGRPYDTARVDLFDQLLTQLDQDPVVVPEADELAGNELQAFVESYFSNYIEGTEFELTEAHDIVVHGRPLQYREHDSHDILGTYQAILESKKNPRFPDSFDAFVDRLRHWNRQVIESRLAMQPGEFKTENNRAGNRFFVEPNSVLGTLEKGYERLMAASTAANRAALAMFVVAEVHPFADGNGRTATLAMNLALSATRLTRIIVPTVYRDDYISALKALSSNRLTAAFGRMLNRAALFSRWLDCRSTDACFGALRASNAMEKPETAKLTFTYKPPTSRAIAKLAR